MGVSFDLIPSQPPAKIEVRYQATPGHLQSQLTSHSYCTPLLIRPLFMQEHVEFKHPYTNKWTTKPAE